MIFQGCGSANCNPAGGFQYIPARWYSRALVTTNDIAGLPVAEQLMLMERLWAALRAHADSGVVPAWHKDIRSARAPVAGAAGSTAENPPCLRSASCVAVPMTLDLGLGE